jgi:hypothetical protein
MVMARCAVRLPPGFWALQRLASEETSRHSIAENSGPDLQVVALSGKCAAEKNIFKPFEFVTETSEE